MSRAANEAELLDAEPHEYRIVLGDTLREPPTDTCDTYHTLRLDFRPASLQLDSGALSIGEDTQGAVLRTTEHEFRGTTEVARGVECLVFFDGEDIRLERVTSKLTLRQQREGQLPKNKKRKIRKDEECKEKTLMRLGHPGGVPTPSMRR